MALKSKIKQLEEIIGADDPTAILDFSAGGSAQPKPSYSVTPQRNIRLGDTTAPAQMVTTQDDLEMDEETSAQPVENMDLYPVGRIEEVSKKEQQQRR